MRKPISMLLFLAATSASAVEPTILPKEPPAPKDVNELPRTESTVYSDPAWDLLSLRISGGLGYQGYRIESDAINLSLSNRRGWIYGIEARYRPVHAWYTFLLGIRRQTTPANYTGSSKFSASDFDVVQDQINAAMILSPFSYFNGPHSGLSNLSLVFGASSRKREAILTLPTNMITSVRSAGLYFGPTYETDLGKGFGLEANLLGYFPFIHYETQTFTGNNKTSFTATASVAVGYRICNFFEIAVRPFVDIEKVSYDQNAQRGTANGKETLTNFGVPLEARVFF